MWDAVAFFVSDRSINLEICCLSTQNGILYGKFQSIYIIRGVIQKQFAYSHVLKCCVETFSLVSSSTALFQLLRCTFCKHHSYLDLKCRGV